MMHSFSPSVNLNRDLTYNLAYIATANAQRAYHQILNDFVLGIHSFSLIGSYGTGKSAFLVAFQQTLNRANTHFPAPNGHFGGADQFDFINIVGSYASIAQTLASKLDVQAEGNIWDILDSRCRQLRQRNGCLVIVIDEFGKFLEYAAQVNPEQELYFIQQLAEYVNGQGQNAALLVTLHQNFSAYSDGLDRKQREEWEKVKGRLKELIFNEPIEQLLELAATQINGSIVSYTVSRLAQLVDVIDDSLAFPHRRKLYIEFAQRLLPFDLLAASVLTQALQQYGQNERSLFTFLNANDHLGLRSYDLERYQFYNLVCVYDYLLHNYNSILSSVHNPHYTQWGAIRSAIERSEANIIARMDDARNLVKIIGLLNIFAPQGAKIGERFLCDYASLTMGMSEVGVVLQELETYKIIRFVRFKESFVLFEGTDLNIELALLEASSKVEPINDVTPLLRKHFVFPLVLVKAVSYQTGAQRFFGYHLSAQPVIAAQEEAIDGTINLIFSESINAKDLLTVSRNQPSPILYCWYRSTRQIRELLYEIEKTTHVIALNENDKVAVGELQKLRSHQIELLNQYVLESMYTVDGSVVWMWHGEEILIAGPAKLNTVLSMICRTMYPDAPTFRNELVNRNGISSAVATARKTYFRALVEHWAEADLAFEPDKYPPEKTIYLTLLKSTGVHRIVDGQWSLDEPLDPSFVKLWQYCEAFLERARVAPKNIADLFDGLRQSPFGLKQGLIDFWVPTFLFIQREVFALYMEERFQPNLTAETLELIRIAPQKFQVKSFSVDGIKLRFLNRCRTSLQQKEANRVTKSGFLETIKPFIVFYNALPVYARQTRRLTSATLRLRTAIANAKDPEKTFFEEFPSALGFPNIADEQTSDTEIEAYISQLQSSVHELHNCFDDLVDRIEAHLLAILGLSGEHFPHYKIAINARFSNLHTYLLLPRQKTFHLRLTAPFEERIGWLGAVIQGILGRDVRQMNDEDELIVFSRLRETIQELDNLCELDNLVVDPAQEANVIRVEITTHGQEKHKLLQRMPKQKETAVATLQTALKEILTDDESVNAAALIRLLQETIVND
jgi:hypothetical protein